MLCHRSQTTFHKCFYKSFSSFNEAKRELQSCVHQRSHILPQFLLSVDSRPHLSSTVPPVLFLNPFPKAVFFFPLPGLYYSFTSLLGTLRSLKSPQQLFSKLCVGERVYGFHFRSATSSAIHPALPKNALFLSCALSVLSFTHTYTYSTLAVTNATGSFVSK